MLNNPPPSPNRGVPTFSTTPLYPAYSKAYSGFLENEKVKKIEANICPKFDWYEGRFSEKDIEKVLSKIMPFIADLHDEVIDSRVAKKGIIKIQRGYAESIQFLLDLEPVLTLSYGGQNGEYGVYFKTTGAYSVEVSNALHDSYGITLSDSSCSISSPILVTRVDVAIDVRADAKTIFRKAISYCKKHALKMDCAGSWTDKDPNFEDNGRTLYIIENKKTKLRIYEKGKQMRGQSADDAPLDWIRIEAQFNAPKGAESKFWKAILAQHSASSIFFSVDSFTELTNILLGLKINHQPIHYRVKSKRKPLDKFVDWLLKTFRERLTDLFNNPELTYVFFNYLYGDDINDYPAVLRPVMEYYLIELDVHKYGDF